MLTFVIIDTSKQDLIDFDECIEGSLEDVKYNIDRTNCIVSFDGEHPEFCFEISDDDVGLNEYTEDQILDIVNTEEWTHLS